MQRIDPDNTHVCPVSWKELNGCIREEGVTIIDWEVASDTLLFSKNQQTGCQFQCSDISRYTDSAANIHKDDLSAVKVIVENVRQGWLYATAEFRIVYEETRYTWYRIHVITLKDEDGAMVRAVGQIINIDQERTALERLRSKAETDALTGLLNREQTELEIKHHLSKQPAELCALFVIDTDNFKHVNDTKGHMLGDAVLSEMAAAMKRVMRDSDIIGRIGGDEFIIFMKNIKTTEAAEKKAEILQQEFHALFQNEKLSLQVTCSIGIAFYPDDATEYKNLFKRADEALYLAKTMGKDNFHVFHACDRHALITSHLRLSDSNVDSDTHGTSKTNDLLSSIFRLLYLTEDTDFAINMILEMAGKRFDVSRSYVFEIAEDGTHCSNVYEWCNTGIMPEKERLKRIDCDFLKSYEKLFDENSIFYCRDISKLKSEPEALLQSQKVHAVLQCALWKDKKFAGFIGFDEYTGVRLWTREEVEVLSLISQMMTTFLQERRRVRWITEMEEQIHTMLDAQNTCLYVIDQNTYEVLYLGPDTKRFHPKIQLGDCCYFALFKKKAPCEFCPLTNGGAGEAVIPGSDVHIKTYASAMKWLGNDAYLLSYHVDSEASVQSKQM